MFIIIVSIDGQKDDELQLPKETNAPEEKEEIANELSEDEHDEESMCTKIQCLKKCLTIAVADDDDEQDNDEHDTTEQTDGKIYSKPLYNRQQRIEVKLYRKHFLGKQ